jgi:hypothetical protein
MLKITGQDRAQWLQRKEKIHNSEVHIESHPENPMVTLHHYLTHSDLMAPVLAATNHNYCSSAHH